MLSVLSATFLMASLFLLRQPTENPEKPLRSILLLSGCFYSGLMLGAWAQSLAGAGPPRGTVIQLIVATISFQGAALFWIHLFLKEHAAGPVESFGLNRRWPYALPIGVIAACAFFPLGMKLQELAAGIMSHWHHGPVKLVEQQAVQTLRIASSWQDRLALGVVTLVLAPVAEELLFRGVIYAWVRQISRPWIAVLISSLLFALVHANLLAFLPLFLFAVMLALLYEKTRNLLACITAHAVFNGLNFLMLYLSESHFPGRR
jgi:membrane protease YdiL (CAAX protease family)